MKRGLTLLLSLAFATGCDATDPGGITFTDPHRAPVSSDAGAARDGAVCARAEEGCPCDGDAPVDCYLDPTPGDDGSMTCHAGTRYCRAGEWTACESIEDYTIRTTGAELLTGPDMCNPCDPRCFGFRDTPTGGDLTPMNSSGAEYDPVRGGIRPRATAPGTMPLPDSDGDGVPDIADDCVGPGAVRAADGSCSGTLFFYHTMPLGGPPAVDAAPIQVQVRTADIYFLMDTTGSMGGELSNLQSQLTTGNFLPGPPPVAIGPPPAAENQANAHNLGTNPTGTLVRTGTTIGRVNDYGGASPCTSTGAAPDVVFRFTLTSTQTFRATTIHPSTPTGFDTVLSLHSGAVGTSPWLCNDDAGGGLRSTIGPVSLPAGTYYVVLEGYGGASGNYGIEFEFGTSSCPGVIGAIRCTIPDAWFGVGFHDDYPRSPYGGGSDFAYRNTLSITSSLPAAQAAVNALTIHWGNDGPESQIPAIWAAATGGGLGGYVAPQTGCPAGTFGYPCFRNGTIPIIINITDAPYHNGPGGAYGYSSAVLAHTPPTFATTGAALLSRAVRIITIQTCGSWSNGYCIEGENHARALGSASGSLGSSGLPYVIRANDDGTGLSSAIVNAIVDLAQYNAMDITARAAGDTMGFTQSIAAVSWGPGTCSGISGGTTFLNCLPGATVNFNVTFRNTTVASTAVPQTFNFFIEVVGDGTAVLARIPVRIVVPATSAAFAPSATYWHDYNSSDPPSGRCSIDERPDWGLITWTADIPAGTNIRIDLRTTDNLAALPTATPVATINITSTGTGTADVSALMRAAGAMSNLRYLRAFVTMNSSADLARAPVLNALSINYTCIPFE